MSTRNPGTPSNTPQQPLQAPEALDDDVALDFFLLPRRIDLFALQGDFAPAPQRPASTAAPRLRAFAIPAHNITTLDHLYGSGTALEHLTARFELKPMARLDESQTEGSVAFLVEEGDYKRLGGAHFEREVSQALQILVSEIPADDAALATDEVAILTLIEAEVLERDHAEKLGDVGREALLAGDLGL